MKNDISNWLGLAQRSGILITGEDTCLFYIKKNAVKLIIIPEDASSQTQKKFQNIARQKNIPFVIYGHRDILSQAIGKANRTVYAIRDQVFATKILYLIEKHRGSLNNRGGE